MLLADSPFAPPPIPGPHPATAELRAYAAGTLGPADEHRIEVHLLECERCADLAEGFSMTDAATTDQAVAELSTRLQARVSTAKPAATRWVAPRVAAAAALLGAVAAGLWSWEQRDTTPSDIATTTTRPTNNAPGAPAPQAPLLEPVAPTPKASAPTGATAPVAPAKEDYAVLAPSPRRVKGFEDERVTAALSDHTEADREPLANNEAASDAPGAPALSEATVSANEAKLADVEVTSAKKSDELKDRKGAITDTVVAPQPTVAADQLAKAKASSAGALVAGRAAARVANTPMPAAPAIAPAPVGGTLALREYLRREAAGFAPEANSSRLDGNVRVRFVVGPDGKLSNLQVTRSLRPDYDAEALRIVCEGPAWQPGIAGGRRAPLPIEVTVPF